MSHVRTIEMAFETPTVAPRAGAWIERFTCKITTWVTLVAPCAGAWIESALWTFTTEPKKVAPCAGAWIERDCLPRFRRWSVESLPVRERGLKVLGFVARCSGTRSLPVRERGLKEPGTGGCVLRTLVAPCAGAWIERPQLAN